MRVTIVNPDGVVLVGGIARKVDLTGLSSAVHAVQWYDTIGEIEFEYDFVANTKAPNVRFTDFSPYQVFVNRWTAAAPSSTAQSTAAIG